MSYCRPVYVYCSVMDEDLYFINDITFQIISWYCTALASSYHLIIYDFYARHNSGVQHFSWCRMHYIVTVLEGIWDREKHVISRSSVLWCFGERRRRVLKENYKEQEELISSTRVLEIVQRHLNQLYRLHETTIMELEDVLLRYYQQKLILRCSWPSASEARCSIILYNWSKS